MVQIGKLEKVDIRKLWTGEAADFTPWLAQENNIAILSETINIDLEVQEQEVNVGPFRADILCKDTTTDHYVLIENQLEKTDHNHLGQLLTYAAGLDAVTIIWIAKQFNEEHRATLDWLNRLTHQDINFFGIEIEVYRIGDSLPAPMFNIVSKPNDWSKTVRRTADNSQYSELKLLQQEYWQKLKDYLESSSTKLKHQKPLPQHWTNFAIGRSNFYLTAFVNSREKFIGINLVISGPNKEKYFEELKKKYELEAGKNISQNLNWRALPEGKESHVQLIEKFDFLDKNNWSNQHQWFKTFLEKYYNFFQLIIKSL